MLLLGQSVTRNVGSLFIYVNVSSLPSLSPPPAFLLAVLDSWILNEFRGFSQSDDGSGMVFSSQNLKLPKG